MLRRQCGLPAPTFGQGIARTMPMRLELSRPFLPHNQNSELTAPVTALRWEHGNWAAKDDRNAAIRQKRYDGTPAEKTMGIKSVTIVGTITMGIRSVTPSTMPAWEKPACLPRTAIQPSRPQRYDESAVIRLQNTMAARDNPSNPYDRKFGTKYDGNQSGNNWAAKYDATMRARQSGKNLTTPVRHREGRQYGS
jgi:hypothetical protein